MNRDKVKVLPPRECPGRRERPGRPGLKRAPAKDNPAGAANREMG